MTCKARQYSDQMQYECGLAWDVNDPEPPACPGMTAVRMRDEPVFNVPDVELERAALDVEKQLEDARRRAEGHPVDWRRECRTVGIDPGHPDGDRTVLPLRHDMGALMIGHCVTYQGRRHRVEGFTLMRRVLYLRLAGVDRPVPFKECEI